MIHKNKNLQGLLSECGGAPPNITINVVNKFKPEIEIEGGELGMGYEDEEEEEESEGEAPEEEGEGASETTVAPSPEMIQHHICPKCGGYMDDHPMEDRLGPDAPLWTEGRSWRK